LLSLEEICIFHIVFALEYVKEYDV